MLIGVLVAGHLSQELETKHGSIDEMFNNAFQDHPVEFRVYAVVNNEFPEDPTDCDAWLITGSAHGVYDRLPFFELLSDFVRRSFELGIPLIGICFGHQFIAHVMGATVERSQVGWCLGPTIYDLGSESVTLQAMHQDQVLTVPTGARVTAKSKDCPIAGLEYGSRAISFQAHPEFGADFMSDLLEEEDRMPADKKLKAKKILGNATQPNFIIQRLMDFLNSSLR